MKKALPPHLLMDFYKVDHVSQYPKDTEVIYSTWTPRGSKLPEITKVVAFGFQAFVQEYLIDYFNDHFFKRPKDEILEEYVRVIKHTLGIKEPKTDHIEALHDLGHLPLLIKALPEGTLVPLRVPMLTIENTDKRFFWVTNWLETLMSTELWHPATTATLAHEYRKILNTYAELTTGSTEGVQFQGHDFSMRGMEGAEAGAKGGMGHLLSFVGTDTIPAILAAEHYYDADITKELVGTSIPASEHSVEEAWGTDEKAAIINRCTVTYPEGFFSRVSDTWDLWHVVADIMADPEVKAAVLGRNGRMVVRPDSGDPVLIVCGDPQSADPRARKGVVELLWDIYGGTITEEGYKVLDPHVGVIYGDAITRDRAKRICEALMTKGFASTNVVYGIGSYTYQFNTRDTFGFAMKTTFGVFGGDGRALFKNPITDDGTKISQKGRVGVCLPEGHSGLVYKDGFMEDPEWSLLKPIFKDGIALNRQSFKQIRALLESQ